MNYLVLYTVKTTVAISYGEKVFSKKFYNNDNIFYRGMDWW